MKRYQWPYKPATNTLTAKNYHGFCPKCGIDFDGDFIWDTGYKFALEGKHYGQNGVGVEHQEAMKLADKYSSGYGADRYQGKFGHVIGIEYNRDCIEEWQCPDCKHTWPRK